MPVESPSPKQSVRPPGFEALYELWYPRVLRTCRRQLGPAFDAESVAQEAFLRAWSSRERCAPDRPFGPWILTIARRLCINELAARERRRPRDFEAPVDEESVQGIGNVERVAELDAISQTLGKIPHYDRRLLLLRDLDGWSYDEIARLEGTTIESVRGRLKRARALFRRLYDGRWAGGPWIVGAARRLGVRTRQAEARSASWWLSRLGHGEAVAIAVAVFLVGGGNTVRPHVAEPPSVLGATAAVPVVAQSTAATSVPTTESAARPVDNHGDAGGQLGEAMFTDPSHGAVDAGTATWLRGSTVSPQYEEDRTVFAWGEGGGRCGNLLRCPLLAKSTDGGATWARLPAAGLPAEDSVEQVLLPPAYPGDDRMFVRTSAVLSVSEDGGRTFRAIGPALGWATMSPLFSAGDPRILLAPGRTAPFATLYDDRDGTITPFKVPGLPSTLTPAMFSFSPTYASDGVVLVSTVGVEAPEYDILQGQGRLGGMTRALYRCERTVCSEVLHYGLLGNDVWVTWSTTAADHVVAWTAFSVHRSGNAGRSFQAVHEVAGLAPWRILHGLQSGRDGRLLALADGDRWLSWLYESDDDGASWKRSAESVPINDFVMLPDGTLLARNGPLLRSTDGGRSWIVPALANAA